MFSTDLSELRPHLHYPGINDILNMFNLKLFYGAALTLNVHARVITL